MNTCRNLANAFGFHVIALVGGSLIRKLNRSAAIMKKFGSLPRWQRFALGAAWLLPWIGFAVLPSDLLPETFRFQKWPTDVQIFCVALFCILVLMEGLFTVWYVFLRSHDNPAPEDKKRKFLLPPGCKDIIDAIRLEPETTSRSMPPITRQVTLPAIVAVRYVAELLSMNPQEIASLSGYSEQRSMPFEQAQKILRRYGIGADRAI